MEPGSQGVGLQVYAFCKETAWVTYERIQSDIFDHILAIVPEFGLKLFQEPTGADFASALHIQGHSET
jgi:miniconductance mechanosensitive channel